MKLTMMLVLGFLLGMYAQTILTPTRYELQTAWHVVKPGETFWSIACDYFDEQEKYKNFNEFLYVVRKANEHLYRGKFLQIGDVVHVPLEVRVK